MPHGRSSSDRPKHCHSSDIEHYHLENIQRSLEDILQHLSTAHYHTPVPQLPPFSDVPSHTNVIFEYTPVWPRGSLTRKTIGILGEDRTETIGLIRRSLPSLADIPTERLELQVRVYDIHPHRAEWVSIAPDAWPSLGGRDGLRVRVVVEMTPEEKVLRDAEDARGGKILLGVVGVPAVIVLICTLLVQGQGKR